MLVLVGVAAHLLVDGLLPRGFRQELNQLAWDAMTRARAASELRNDDAHTAAPWDRFVFVDVSDRTCLEWQKTPCTMSSITPRNKLAAVIDKITAIGKPGEPQHLPALVVLDMDLAPVTGADHAHDATLCASVVRLAAKVPVIVTRPTAVDVADKRVLGYRSIFDPAFSKAPSSDCPFSSDHTAEDWARAQHNLWFGSPLVWTDRDGVVRQVGTGQSVTIVEGKTGADGDTTLGSIGLLGGALLTMDKQAGPDVLKCLFPGSRRLPDQTRQRGSQQIEEAARCPVPEAAGYTAASRLENILRDHQVKKDLSYSPTSIFFSVPLLEPGSEASHLGVVRTLCRLPAHRLGLPPGDLPVSADHATCERPNAMAGAVVVIGGSYLASGDLHRTPIDPVVPGALIHINAIRAFTKDLLSDRERWVFDVSEHEVGWIPTALTIILGMLSHILARSASRGRGAARAAWANLVVFTVGVAVQVLAIIAFAVAVGTEQFLAGKLVEVLTPALAVIVEGLGQALYALHDLIDALFGPAVDAVVERYLPAVRTEKDVQAAATNEGQARYLAISNGPAEHQITRSPRDAG